MSWQRIQKLTIFNGLSLPSMKRMSLGGGEARTNLTLIPGQVYYDPYQGGDAPIVPPTITATFTIAEVPVGIAVTYSALDAQVGKRGTLTGENYAGSTQTATAYLKRIGGELPDTPIDVLQVIEIDLVFELVTEFS